MELLLIYRHIYPYQKIINSCCDSDSPRCIWERIWRLKKITAVVNAYLNKNECSVQECVYHALLGQWLKRTFRGVIFANSSIPEKGFFSVKMKIWFCQRIQKTYSSENLIDRYNDLPNITSFSGKNRFLILFITQNFKYFFM